MAEQPPLHRKRHLSPRLLSVIFSLLVLLVPLFAVYIAQFGDRRPDPANITALQVPYSASQQLQLLEVTLPVESPREGAVFHLCEEQGKMVYKIRLTKSGDEMTVCAETGKLLAVTGSKQDDPMNLMMPMKKS